MLLFQLLASFTKEIGIDFESICLELLTKDNFQQLTPDSLAYFAEYFAKQEQERQNQWLNKLRGTEPYEEGNIVGLVARTHLSYLIKENIDLSNFAPLIKRLSQESITALVKTGIEEREGHQNIQLKSEFSLDAIASLLTIYYGLSIPIDQNRYAYLADFVAKRALENGELHSLQPLFLAEALKQSSHGQLPAILKSVDVFIPKVQAIGNNDHQYYHSFYIHLLATLIEAGQVNTALKLYKKIFPKVSRWIIMVFLKLYF